MAVYNDWTVEYKNGSTWTEIPNVQDLSCQVGRQTAVDQWPVSQASIRVWYPEGWASPLANLTIGTYIRFFAPGRSSTKPSWTGLVKDLVIEVGIPWNSGTSDGNADFLVIECEGQLASTGRTKTKDFDLLSDNWNALWVAVVIGYTPPNGLNIPAYLDISSGWYDEVEWGDTGGPPNEWNTNALEMLNQTVIASQARVCDGVKKTWTYSGSAGAADDPAIYLGRPAYDDPTITTVGFSDTTNNSTNRIYDQVTFDGLADLYFTQAVLSYMNNMPTGTTVELTSSVGTEPYRTYAAQLPPNGLGYSQSIADYYANQFTPADIGIASISATTNGQHTQNLDTLGVSDLELGYLPLYVVPVTLRGQTFYCQIEGVQITADTNSARFTYYVTPTGTTAWFTLDSSTFGVLDENRLGIY